MPVELPMLYMPKRLGVNDQVLLPFSVSTRHKWHYNAQNPHQPQEPHHGFSPAARRKSFSSFGRSANVRAKMQPNFSPRYSA